MEIRIPLSRPKAVAAALMLIIATSVYVVMATGFTAGQSSHLTLFTDTIRGKTSGSVAVLDDLGVGTSAPVHSLQVIRSAVDSQNVGAFDGQNINNFGLDVRILNDAGNNRPILQLRSGPSSTTKMFVGGSGNVGIGTSSPVRKLHVVDASGGIAIPLRLQGTFASGANTGVGIDFDQGAGFPLGQINAVHTGANSEDFYFNLEGANTLQNAVRMEGATGNVFARGSFVPGSDARYKSDIKPLTDSLDRVLALQGVSFTRKDDPAQKRQVGLIAQDVEQVVPEVVFTDSSGMKGLAYENLVALLIESVKELQDQNNELRSLVCQDHPDAAACN